jgi:hypothetical protein
MTDVEIVSLYYQTTPSVQQLEDALQFHPNVLTTTIAVEIVFAHLLWFCVLPPMNANQKFAQTQIKFTTWILVNVNAQTSATVITKTTKPVNVNALTHQNAEMNNY